MSKHNFRMKLEVELRGRPHHYFLIALTALLGVAIRIWW